MAHGLDRFGATRQRLLRALLLAPDGLGVEDLGERLGVTHNAVRQHLTALTTAGFTRRTQPRATGGRPQARYVLTPAGRDVFPRNYDAIAAALVSQLQARLGVAEVGMLLQQVGTTVAASQPRMASGAGMEAIARILAEHLDGLGYEAMPVHDREGWHVEAFNCVFHDLAQEHPDICRFDLALLEALSGRQIQHVESIARDGRICRFRVGGTRQDIPSPDV